ncbi:MAG: tetratricopeptide repeat protein [Flavobacterium sp.]
MKQLFTIFSLLVLIPGFSQEILWNKKRVDSLNALPYEEVVSNAVSLTKIYKEAAAFAQQDRYLKGETQAYEKLGLIYYYLGQYDQQHTYLLKAIKGYEQLNDTPKLIAMYGGYGYQIKRRDMPKALFYMQKALRMDSQEKYIESVPVIDNYGVLKEMLGELDSAKYYYYKALTFKENTNDSLGIPYSLHKIAGVYVMEKKFSEALPLIHRALAIRQKRKDVIGLAESYTFLGEYYQAVGELEKARDYFSQSNKLARQHQYKYLAQESYRNLSDIAASLGNYPEALEQYKSYTKYKDSILNLETNNRVAALEIAFETEQKDKEILRNKARLAEKNLQLVVLLFLFVLAVLLGYGFWYRQRIKTVQLERENALKEALSKIEIQRQLQEQRLLISRDLHDSIGAQLTFIISSVDHLKYQWSKEQPELHQRLEHISDFTRTTIVELRDTIWAMNKEAITGDDLESRIANFINQATLSVGHIQFEFVMDDILKQHMQLGARRGMHLYRIIQEAVNNALKHAHAKHIRVSLHPTHISNQIELQVKDDGKGIDMDTLELGNGLNNMKKRASEMGGDFSIKKGDIGTEISMLFYQ